MLKKKTEKIILSEEQVKNEIKEISKLEIPLEINKRIKKLVIDSDISLQTLQKQLNYEKKKEKGMVESSVTDNTDNTDNTDDTHNTNGCVLSVLCDKSILRSLFGENTFDKILYILATEKDVFTYDKIAKMLGKEPDNIRQAINRKSEYFTLKKPDGKICHTYLSQMAVDELMLKVNRLAENLRKKEEFEKKQKELENEQKDELIELRNFFNLYKKEFSKTIKDGSNILYLDFMKLAEFSVKWIDKLESNPEETLNLIEMAFEESGLIKNVRIRLFNLPTNFKRNIEQLRSCDVDSLISLTGRVITLSDIRPQCVNAKFECPSCGTIMSVLQIEKKFREPPRCSCGRRGGFKLLSKEMVDTARLILEDLQEKTDNPHSKRINCFIKEDLLSESNMKLYTPGNEIELIGVLKEVPVPLKTGGLSTRFEIAFEVNSVYQAKEEITFDKLTEEDIEKIKELSFKIDKNGLKEINESFAPEIYGYLHIKNAIILQLASKKNNIGKERKKNKPNILLIGEPGVAKTVLGEFAVDITNGARKSVGGSASAVGFTGAVVRDEYSGGWSLEPGAFVLAKDFFLLDELNNIKEEDRPRLQEALSENTITIDKATIHTRLSAPAGVLATANPVNGVFNEGEDITKQFSLTAPIINRFDLIFVLKDSVNKEVDEMIAKKMNERERKKINCQYDKDFLRKFFIYIKEQENPVIEDDISEKISKVYSKLRSYKTKSLNINPRVHLALLQLCKASARIRLSEKVEEKDIELALEILSSSYFKTPTYKALENKI